MAEFRLSNELGFNRSLCVLENDRKCVCHCTFCSPQLNRKIQYAHKQSRDEDPGTFESTIEKAFGISYDPTNIIQFSLKEKVPFVWASGVEPWQDVGQARAILQTIRALDLPVFFQSRSTNFRVLWPEIAALAGNAACYVSIPSLNPKYVKRFEPGTPSIEERIELVKACASVGIPAMVAVAPYHPEWCEDFAGLVRQAHSWGATDIFVDILHLNRRQRQAITELGGDTVLLGLSCSAWDEDVAAAWAAGAAACADLGMGFEAPRSKAMIYGIPSFESADPWPFRDALYWPYTEQPYYADLYLLHGEEPDGGPILVTWEAALDAMEEDGVIDQPFSWSSLSPLLSVKTLAPAWKRVLQPAAPIREYLRALWNTPGTSGVPWHHPFVRVAMDPSGQPWRDDGGNLILSYDPSCNLKSVEQAIEDVDECRRLLYAEVEGE